MASSGQQPMADAADTGTGHCVVSPGWRIMPSILLAQGWALSLPMPFEKVANLRLPLFGRTSHFPMISSYTTDFLSAPSVSSRNPVESLYVRMLVNT